MKKILVTGGSGFIGSHTCLLLLEEGHEIFVIDSHINSSPKSLERLSTIIEAENIFLNGKLHIYKGDLRDNKILKKIFLDANKNGGSIDAVLHFAGLKSVSESFNSPMLYWDANVNSTINLLKVMEANNCKTIIFSSSANIYNSKTPQLTTENSEINPVNPYGRTKAVIERILTDIFESASDTWRIANLRYFNPIGAHPSGFIGEDPQGVPSNLFPFITQVAAGRRKELTIFGNNWPTKDGTGVRDYIHVMDLAEGHLRALKYLLDSKPRLLNLNLGTGKGTSVLELIETFEKVNKVSIPYSFVNRRKGDLPITIASNELCKTCLNWTPQRTLEDMCRDGWKWQLQNPKGYFNSNENF